MVVADGSDSEVTCCDGKALTTRQGGLLQEIILIYPVPHLAVPGTFEIAARVCLPDAIHLKSRVARSPDSSVAQHLLAEVIHAVLVVRESVFVGVVCESRVQVEQTVILVVERHRERLVVGAEATCAVGADSPFGPPPASAPGAP